MNSESKVPTWRMNKPLSWEDWLKGRRARRELGDRVAPDIIRRKPCSRDKRLRELFNGERGLPFTPTDKL